MKSLRCLTLMLISGFLIGCATKYEPAPAPAFCTIGRAIYPSHEDVMTPETKRQILAHDELGARLCGWGPKTKATEK